ncbi:hypothetical protein SESBI_09399 [Sesbania bispinosa]|nr:hypothetical protein SESBI_09399 [Sesbania bispinosa]
MQPLPLRRKSKRKQTAGEQTAEQSKVEIERQNKDAGRRESKGKEIERRCGSIVALRCCVAAVLGE